MAQCLIYCRVSTEEQAEKGYSLDTQAKLCRDYAERNGYQVAGVFRDEGKSGTTLDRPALQDLLAKCTKGTVIGAIFVQETDRLARNTHDHLTIRALLQKAGVKLISVAQPMLDDSPEGKMIDTILASVNQFQSDLSGRKVRKALQEKFEQGWWPVSAPVGYINVAVGDDSNGQRIRSIIQPDPRSWHALQDGFRLYLTGSYSADEIRDMLHKQGVRSKTGKRIPHSVMVRMLRSPFYAGVMVWKGQRRIGRHKPIITLEEHEQILHIIDSHNLHACRRRKHNFLLRGFVFCNICGQRYTADIHLSKGKSYYHCACRQQHSNRNQHVEVDALEKQIEEQFRAIQFSPEFTASVIAKLQHYHASHKSTIEEKKNVLLNQQKGIEQKRNRAEEKLLKGVLQDDAFVRLRTQFNEQLQQIQEQLVVLNSQQEYDINGVRQVLSLLHDIYDTYKKSADTVKRLYLGIFWERFLVQDKEIVEAVPAQFILALQQEREVLLDSSKRGVPRYIITLQDQAYLSELRERVNAIKALANKMRDEAVE